MRTDGLIYEHLQILFDKTFGSLVLVSKKRCHLRLLVLTGDCCRDFSALRCQFYFFNPSHIWRVL